MEKFNLVTHNDMDGVGPFIIIRNVKELHDALIKVRPTGYGFINKKLEDAAKESKVVLITDLAINTEQAKFVSENFSRATLIDHHPTTERITFNLKKYGIVYSSEFSATELTYNRYRSYIAGNHLDELIYLINNYDMFKNVEKEALWLNEVYWKYGFWEFADIFKKGLDLDYLREGRTLWEDKEKRYNETEHMRIGDNDETIVLFGTEFLTNAMIENPENIISVNSPTKISVRSKRGLETFYMDVNSSFKHDIFSVGGHKYAGGIEFKRNITENDILKLQTLLELPF